MAAEDPTTRCCSTIWQPHHARTPLTVPVTLMWKGFDGFAASFDDKLASLEYRAPELIRDAFASVYPSAAASLDIADAGCGTGLCEPLLAPWARRLCGFDLSGGMLSKAQSRSVYTDLHKAELVAFLRDSVAAFDVIVSADTLCYLLHWATPCAPRVMRCVPAAMCSTRSKPRTMTRSHIACCRPGVTRTAWSMLPPQPVLPACG